MGNIFVVQNGICKAFLRSDIQHRKISFPLHASVLPKESFGRIYSSFILNVDWEGIFVFTDQPLAEGTMVLTKFLIPPDAKVLADFVGFVLASKSPIPKYPGMFIKFIDFGQQEMGKLVACLEGRTPLVDQTG